MSAAAGAPPGPGGTAPRVAADDPPSTWAGLKGELAPRPGRAANTLRLTAIVLIVVAICETFRIPEASLAAYVAFFIFKSDADATVPMATLGGIAMVCGILVAILYLAATLAEPALRLPLMAVIAFATLYLTQASALGFAAYGAGLFTVKALTEGDDLLKGALGGDQVTDTEHLTLPTLAFMSPEEALVHNLLWLALAIAVAVAVVVAVDVLTGPDPERKLRAALAGRLDAMAALCAGREGARRRLAVFAEQGMAVLAEQNAVAGKLKRGRYAPAFGEAVIAAIWELMLVLLAFGRLPEALRPPGVLAPAAPMLSAAAEAVRRGGPVAGGGPVPADAPAPADRPPALAAFEERLARSLAALREAVDAREPAAPDAPLGGFFKPDAFSNRGYARFALKVTLAVMACELFMNLADWSSIDSCITTCFVIALASFGQSAHKMILRVSGALVGAAIGFGYILFVMPLLSDIGQLLAVMAPVILAAAWIKTGGERTNYLGQQLAFAFMLVILQNYGPTLHFQTGRDRVIGILVGELAFCVVFIHLWPVSVGDVVRKGTAGALGQLAALLGPGGRARAAAGIRSVGEGLGKARAMLVDDPYEPARVKAHAARASGALIDADVLSRVQALAVPVAILAAEPRGGEAPGGAESDAYRDAAGRWLARLARWFGGEADDTLGGSLPQPPPAGEGAAAVWCRILDGDLRALLAAVGLDAPARQPPS